MRILALVAFFLMGISAFGAEKQFPSTAAELTALIWKVGQNGVYTVTTVTDGQGELKGFSVEVWSQKSLDALRKEFEGYQGPPIFFEGLLGFVIQGPGYVGVESSVCHTALTASKKP